MRSATWSHLLSPGATKGHQGNKGDPRATLGERYRERFPSRSHQEPLSAPCYLGHLDVTRSHQQPPGQQGITKKLKNVCTFVSKLCPSGSLMEALAATQCSALPRATCCHQDVPGAFNAERYLEPLDSARNHQEPLGQQGRAWSQLDREREKEKGIYRLPPRSYREPLSAQCYLGQQLHLHLEK